MKKSERKQKKAAQKAVKENIKINLMKALQQVVTGLGAESAKVEKQLLKGSKKLAKKIARLLPQPAAAEAPAI